MPDEVRDEVLEWDVDNGGRLGALIVCRYCDGTGTGPEDHGSGQVELLGCPDCTGDGNLHRPYPLPVAQAPNGLGTEPAVGMLDALDAAVELMVQRIKVLRRVARLERERVDGVPEVPADDEGIREWH